MGRKSTIENKNIYHLSREELNLSRDKAADLLETVSRDRIEKIENGYIAYPEEILAMEEKYKNPLLCNYYCSHDCVIGQKYTPTVKIKDSSQITLEMMVMLESLYKQRDRLAEIMVDGTISEEEAKDFKSIKQQLNQMASVIDSLNVWVDQAIMDGKADDSLAEE